MLPNKKTLDIEVVGCAVTIKSDDVGTKAGNYYENLWLDLLRRTCRINLATSLVSIINS